LFTNLVNEKKQVARYTPNELLEKSFTPSEMIKGGLLMLIVNQINRIIPPERIITLPL
jgi:hypothetical protein